MPTELDEHAEDLNHVKSVLTELGYRTKNSIATLKTVKKIDCLELAYTKMKSINSKSMAERFPDLGSIDTFTPGMKSTIMAIATHLSRSSTNSLDLKEKTKSKILLQGKEVFDFVHIPYVSFICFIKWFLLFQVL